MTDRSLRVRLEATVSGYVTGMGQAAAATEKVAKSGKNATKQARDWDGLAAGLGRFGGVAALAVGGAVKTFADFDAAMSQVKANSGATGPELDKLEQSIRAAGKASVFSATEAAEGANELAKAGMSASDIMGGALTGSLTLAAAGGVSMGRAAEVSANAMSVFGLKASDAGHIADVFANGANASTASVDSLAQGLSQSGAVAASFGLTMDETVGVLAQFDQAGLKGSDAGTSLKSMLQALVNPSKKASETMSELGINAFDAQGNFVGLDGLAGQLKTSMAGLTQEQRGQAMATIFGSDAVRAANILFKDGAGKTAEWATAMGKSGAAAELAGKNTDNLKGDLEQLKGALEDLMIGSSGGLADGLRPIVQALTGLLDLAGKIPAPLVTAGAALVTLAAVGALAGAAGIKVVQGWKSAAATVSTFTGATSRVNTAVFTRMRGDMDGVVRTASGMPVAMGAFGASVQRLGTYVPVIGRMQTSFVTAAAAAERFPRSAGMAAAGMTAIKSAGSGLMGVLGGPWGVALAAGGLALGAWAKHQQQAAASAAAHKAKVQELASTLNQNTGAITNNTKAVAAKDAADKNLITRASEYGLSAETVMGAMLGQKDALDQVNTVLGGTADRYKEAAARNGEYGDAQNKAAGKARDLQKDITGTSDALRTSQEQLSKTKTASDAAGRAMSGVGVGAQAFSTAAKAAGDAAQKAADQTKAWESSLKTLGDSMLAMRGDQVAYQAALQGANDALKENGRNLDITTEKGRANRTALDGVAASAKKWATSTYEANGSMQEAESILATGRNSYVKLATSMGYSRAEAERLAAQYISMPKDVAVGVKVEGVEGATYAVNQLGENVIRLSGRKVDIPVSTPNAQQVASLLTSVGTAAFDASKQTVNIPVGTLGAEQTKAVLGTVEGARENADGSITIPVEQLNGQAVTKILDSVTTAARTADGQTVVVPASTPNAPAVAKALQGIDAAAVSADAKSVNIIASSPLAPAVKAKINAIEGATVSADSKSVKVDTSSPNAAATVRQINGILSAARSADAAFVNVSTSTNANQTAAQVRGLLGAAVSKTIYVRTVMQTINDSRGGGQRYGQELANGGILNGAGVRAFANGGFESHHAQIAPAGAWRVWAEPETGGEAYIPLAASKRARSMDILERTARIFGASVVKRADGGLDKARLSAMRAWQPSSPRVSTASPAVDLTPLMQAMQSNASTPVHVTVMTPDRKVLASMVAEGRRDGRWRQ